jgi:transposase
VENAIRPTAVGRKNYPSLRSGSAVWLRCYDAAHATRQCLFIGDAEAGERGAIVFTVIEACRRRGINPFDYLRDVFTRMPAISKGAARDGCSPFAFETDQLRWKRSWRNQ